MSVVAVCFSFGVEPGHPPLVGAAPWTVLSRQIPRLVVQLGNGDGDAGLRFFPFLGPVDGVRQFLDVPGLVELDNLRSLVQTVGAPRFLVDGVLGIDALRLRIFDDDLGATVLATTIPFDPHQPLLLARRLAFELDTALHSIQHQTALPTAEWPALSPLGLAHLLVARDDLLALEAGIERADPATWLRAIRAAVECESIKDTLLEQTVAALVAIVLERQLDDDGLMALLRQAGGKGSAWLEARLALIWSKLAERALATEDRDHLRRLLPAVRWCARQQTEPADAFLLIGVVRHRLAQPQKARAAWAIARRLGADADVIASLGTVESDLDVL